jgi:hypothetical protein
MQLWRYARATGQTPAHAIEDPDFPFNMTVMRAHDAARSLKLGELYRKLPKDGFGISHVIETLRLLYEDQ